MSDTILNAVAASDHEDVASGSENGANCGRRDS